MLNVHNPKYNNSVPNSKNVGSLTSRLLMRKFAWCLEVTLGYFYLQFYLIQSFLQQDLEIMRNEHLLYELLLFIIPNLDADSIQCQSLQRKCVAHMTMAVSWVFHKAWKNKHDLAEIRWSTWTSIAPRNSWDIPEFCYPYRLKNN
jgi:hypothetical protein